MIEDKRPPFEPLLKRGTDKFNIPTPAYVIDEAKLILNGKILKDVSDKTGCKILLAQKAFSNFYFYPALAPYLAGTEASGLFEARLGREKMGDNEVHVFCGAYTDGEFEDILLYADHIVFNSLNQLHKFGKKAKAAGKSVGLRINPQCSTQAGHGIYDPCAEGSRLGVTREQWDKYADEKTLSLLDGIHFHTLCEQNSDDLLKTLYAVNEKFGDIIKNMKWVNMGGGHHITRPDYDLQTLYKCIEYAKNTWGTEVYLEPGEAVALNAGFMITKVLDIVENSGIKTAVTDVSAACHMPDVIEMPYLPPLYNASENPTGKYKYKYRTAGRTCLAGDITGDYYFPSEIKTGDTLIFGDMAIYTTCKNNTFNGMPLPDIWAWKKDGELLRLTDFSYTDFISRLG